MKKKIIYIGAMTMLVGMLAGCQSKTSDAARGTGQTVSVADVLEDKIAETDAGKKTITGPVEIESPTPSPAPTPEPTPKEPVVLSKTEGIDVDLTILSATMVYSEVYNMMVLPEDYIGKTVRMGGSFSIYSDPSGNNYYACIIQDATACCAQGIEFVLTEDYSYPDDYPEEGDEIVVAGVFDTYQEGEYTYCTLRGARLE